VIDIIVPYPTNDGRRQALRRALRRNGPTLITLELVVLVNLLAVQVVPRVPLAIISALIVATVAVVTRERQAGASADVDRLGAVFAASEARKVLDNWMLVMPAGPGWEPGVTIRGLAAEIPGDAAAAGIPKLGPRSRQLSHELDEQHTEFLAAAGQTGDPDVKRIALAFAADLGHASTDAIELHVNLDILKSKRHESERQEASVSAHELSEYERVSVEAYRKLGERLSKAVRDGEALMRLVSTR
jgi:hypothetical protein